MATVYRIAKWRETYETADSRKHKSLSWVSMPIGFQSNGYQLLIDQFPDDAPAIYGAWCALVGIAAQCHERGLLANSRGEGLSAERIARMAFMPVEPFRKLLPWASSESVRWLDVVSDDGDAIDGQSISDQSPIDQQSIDDQPLTSLPNLTLPNQTKPIDASASCSEPASPASEPETLGEDDPNVIVLEFPVVGDKRKPTWGLKRGKAREYVESYPGVDVKAELLKARQWCRDHEAERKTARGMLKFLNGWLSRSQNDATKRQRGSPAQHKSRGQIATENFLARNKQAQHGQSGMRLLGSEPDLRGVRSPSG